MNKLERLENLLLAVWGGTLIGIGYIAAPILFKALDDRALAGNLAGQMFHIIMLEGLVIGAILLLLRYKSEGPSFFSHWRGWLLSLMLIFVAFSIFVLQPMIVETKALGLVEGSDTAKRFGMLHGISSLMYLVTTLSACVLVFMGISKK